MGAKEVIQKMSQLKDNNPGNTELMHDYVLLKLNHLLSDDMASKYSIC